MHKKNVTANFNVPQIFIDSGLILLSYFMSHSIYTAIRGIHLDFQHIWMYIIYSVIFGLCMLLFRMYNVTTFNYLDRVIKNTVLSAVISAACICAMIFLSKYETASRLFFLIFAAASFSFVLAFRMLTRWMCSNNIGNGCTHVLFIGDETTCEQYKRYIAKTSMKIIVECRVDFHSHLLRTESAFEALLVNLAVDEIVIVQSIKGNDSINVPLLLRICEDMGLTIRLLLTPYDLPASKHFISSIGLYPVLTYHSVSLDKVQAFFKSVMDVIGAIAGVLVFSPIFLITAVAIKLESPGPVFFKQTRVGQNGKCFKIYKFRSMYQDAEERKKDLLSQNKIKGGLMFKMDNDPRITRVGKFIREASIDELPQLLNVIKRDMSLVGTRPPTMDEVAKYNRCHRRRISIRPGITGMWQISGRSNILDFEKVVELDNQYIEQWSLALDIKLIFKTVIAVLTHQGAS